MQEFLPNLHVRTTCLLELCDFSDDTYWVISIDIQNQSCHSHYKCTSQKVFILMRCIVRAKVKYNCPCARHEGMLGVGV
jgi:hypothetical protein